MKAIFLILLSFIMSACEAPFHLSANTTENGVQKHYYFGSSSPVKTPDAVKTDSLTSVK